MGGIEMMQFENKSCLMYFDCEGVQLDSHAIVLKGYQEEKDCLVLQIGDILH
jgi:hypothetical protein